MSATLLTVPPEPKYVPLAMSLRDTFACHAIASLGGLPKNQEEAKDAAQRAYALAEALLAERETHVRAAIAKRIEWLKAAAKRDERARGASMDEPALRRHSQSCLAEAKRLSKVLETSDGVARFIEDERASGTVGVVA